jgi:hypothetical protein
MRGKHIDSLIPEVVRQNEAPIIVALSASYGLPGYSMLNNKQKLYLTLRREHQFMEEVIWKEMSVSKVQGARWLTWQKRRETAFIACLELVEDFGNPEVDTMLEASLWLEAARSARKRIHRLIITGTDKEALAASKLALMTTGLLQGGTNRVRPPTETEEKEESFVVERTTREDSVSEKVTVKK